MTRRVVLDCDTGTDDAVAIMLAALHPELDLVGVSTVWGNAAVDVTTENTLRVLRLLGREAVPVARGAAASSSPPPRRLEPSRSVHLDLPAARRHVHAEPAAEWLVETLHERKPVTLVATGPLTNVAAALALDPGLTEVVDEVAVMGGSHARAGVTPVAERNFWHDALAAATVLAAGFERLVLVPLDATYAAALTREHARCLAGLDTSAGDAAAALVEQRITDYASVPDMAARGAAPVHDALAVAYLVQPSLVQLRHLHVKVRQGGPEHGRSVMDLEGAPGATPNAHVALDADPAAYADLLLRTFAR